IQEVPRVRRLLGVSRARARGVLPRLSALRGALRLLGGRAVSPGLLPRLRIHRLADAALFAPATAIGLGRGLFEVPARQRRADRASGRRPAGARADPTPP